MTRTIKGTAEIAFVLGPPMLIAEKEVPEHIAAPFRVWAKSLFAPEELGERPTLTVGVTVECNRQEASSNYPGHHEHTGCVAEDAMLYDERILRHIENPLCKWLTSEFGDTGPLDDVTQYEDE